MALSSKTAVVAPSPWAKLYEFGRLKDNWDSYGARATTWQARDQAWRIMLSFARSGVTLPTPFPSVDGGIRLEWGHTADEIIIDPYGKAVWEIYEPQGLELAR